MLIKYRVNLALNRSTRHNNHSTECNILENLVSAIYCLLFKGEGCVEFDYQRTPISIGMGIRLLHQYLSTSASGRGYRRLNLKSAQPVRIDTELCIVLYLTLYLLLPIALVSKVSTTRVYASLTVINPSA